MITRITDLEKDAICALYKEGKSLTDIVKIYPCSRTTVYLILLEKEVPRRARTQPKKRECGTKIERYRLSYKNTILTLTKKGLYERYKSWGAARNTVGRHSFKVFHRSGKPKICVNCGYSKHIEVAHIKAVSDFPDEATLSEINNINNLMALCPNCHWEFDNGILLLTTLPESGIL